MPVSIHTMRVQKYIPDRLFGFAVGPVGREVFFHLGAFDPGAVPDSPIRCKACPSGGCTWAEAPPPPILGELVEVKVDLDVVGEKAPRAERVRRLVTPMMLRGVVESFDHYRGYGFLAGDDGISYHLHKSEVLDGRLPLPHQAVSFYAGSRQERPRACHVKVCP